MRNTIYLLILCLISACSAKDKELDNEILWDTWGIPHIYADGDETSYQMMGWAQARNHGDLLLKLYGEARAKSAEYWSREADRDQLLLQLGIVDAAEKSWTSMPAPERAIVTAFTEGINAYAAKHPDAIGPQYRQVLPVTPQDIMRHAFRVLYFEFLVNRNLGTTRGWSPGSNAWAVNGKKTASGHSMLLANPHLPWNDLWLFFEAHLITPDHNLYGATLVGLPMLGIAFNEHLGWTHTVNTLDNVEIYEITTRGQTYLLDGQNVEFDMDSVMLRIMTDGTLEEKWVVKKRSKFGFVLKEEGNKALTVYWPNMDGQHNVLGQWRAMGKASSLSEFETALDHNALPLFNVIYADKEDNILYHFGGHVPKKNGGWNKWQEIVSASTADESWTGYYSKAELPRYLNPESGWIQNANDPPFTSTWPLEIRPEEYASHIAPNHMGFRPQRSARLIQDADNLTLEDFIRLKHDTKSELALRIKDELQDLQGNDSLTHAALEVLTSWDGSFDAESEQAVLFLNLFRQIGIHGYFEEPWSFDDPLNTPDGLANDAEMLAAIKKAAQGQMDEMGQLQVPFGDLFRFKVGSHEFPAHGAPGSLGLFRTIHYAPAEDGRSYAVHGDSYICVTEFDGQLKAKALLSYGNATQPNNPHVGDQLELFAQKKLRDVWLTRADQEANLELVERLDEM